MRHYKSIIGSFLAVVLLSGQAFSATDGVPPLINYQGRLTDQSGAPLTAGTYTICFRVWSTPSGTSPSDLIWSQQQQASVTANGVFNVILGAPGGSPIADETPKVNDLTFAFTETNRYLGITLTSRAGTPIPNPSEILPRQRLLSVPYAVLAQGVADKAIGSNQIANGSITLDKLAPRTTANPAPAGAIAMSSTVTQDIGSSDWTTVSGLNVVLSSSGRPVSVYLVAGPESYNDQYGSYVSIGGTGIGGSCLLAFCRDGEVVNKVRFGGVGADSGGRGYGYTCPPGAFQCLDLAAAPGTHTYSIKVKWDSYSNAAIGIRLVRLVAIEL